MRLSPDSFCPYCGAADLECGVPIRDTETGEDDPAWLICMSTGNDYHVPEWESDAAKERDE